MRTYIPDETLNASNSKVVGVSTDRNGNLKQIRVKFTHRPNMTNKVIVKAEVLLNTIELPQQLVRAQP